MSYYMDYMKSISFEMQKKGKFHVELEKPYVVMITNLSDFIFMRFHVI